MVEEEPAVHRLTKKNDTGWAMLVSKERDKQPVFKGESVVSQVHRRMFRVPQPWGNGTRAQAQ